MPNVPVELVGREQIRGWGERVPALVEYLVPNQAGHPWAAYEQWVPVLTA